MILTRQQISNLTPEQLIELVNNPVIRENDQLDFKETYDLNPKEVRKDFSAFANSKGGFIFFGVDKNRRICGVNRDDELETSLNRMLANPALQPRLYKWEVLKTLCVQSTPEKIVYICYIYPSTSVYKPHVADERIYVRQNGESKPIASGMDLRGLFFTSKFYPEHIDQLELELAIIQDYEYRANELDIIYFKNLGAYLKNLKKEYAPPHETVDGLLVQYDKMRILIEDVGRSAASVHSATGVPPLTVPDDLQQKYIELKEVALEFILKFKGFHNL